VPTSQESFEMNNGRILGIALLIAGALLLFFGFTAYDSVSSDASRLFQGAPSNKAVVLLVVGAAAAIFGLVSLNRRHVG
jgi:hypothetical protein